MKIFLIAFACEPNRTSEPGVGWNIAGEMAKRHELTVLTRSNNRDVIEKFLKTNGGSPWSKIHWVYFELPEWFHKLKKHLPCGIQLYQELWQRGVAKKYKDAFSDYDIVHHLTFGSIFFTPWAARYAKRFVWGPVGGAVGAMEPAFLKNENLHSQLSEKVYRLIAWYSYHPTRFAERCRKACRAILFRVSELGKSSLVSGDQITDVVSETAYAGEAHERTYISGHHPLRIMSVGRLIPLKGVGYTIKSFAQFIHAGGEGILDIYGDGPLKKSLVQLAEALKVSDRVVFHGNVPNQEVLQALDASDLLIHASFREGGSWTILEAMAHGVPVICQDRAGMKDMVTGDCGIKINARSPRELTDQMAQAIKRYADDPSLMVEQGHRAQERVKSVYRWEKIADRIDAVYHEVMK